MVNNRAPNVVPLTTAQAVYLARNPSNPHYMNIPRLLSVPADFQPRCFQRAMHYVQMHHETLRLRFIHDSSGWHQYLTRASHEIPFTSIDLTAQPVSEQAQAIERISAELQASLNLFNGPVWRVAYFNCGPSRAGRLLLFIHHFVTDGFSFPIVLEDLQTVYHQICAGEPVLLPPVLTSFSTCARQQMEYAQSAQMKQDLAYWLSQPWTRSAHLPLDYPDSKVANCVAFKQEVTASLSVAETQMFLRDVPRAYNAQIHEVLLTAVLRAIRHWAGVNVLPVSVILNGRNTYAMFEQTPLAHLDITRTVGYLSYSVDHLVLDLGQSGTIEGELQELQQQFRCMPHLGFSSPALRYLCQDATIVQKMRALPAYDVRFNYLGDQKTRRTATVPLFQAVQEKSGPSRDPRNPLRSPMVCQATIIDDQLMTSWEYNDHFHRRATIEALLRTYTETLRTLIARSQGPVLGQEEQSAPVRERDSTTEQ